MNDFNVRIRFSFCNGEKRVYRYSESQYQDFLEKIKYGFEGFTSVGENFGFNGTHLCFFERLEDLSEIIKKKWYQRIFNGRE